MSDVIAGKNLKKTNNWKRSLAVCTPTKIFLYDNEQDKSNKAFSLAIDINKVDSVRPMEHGELWRISAKNVPRLFRISFFSDDRTAADLDVSVVSGYFFFVYMLLLYHSFGDSENLVQNISYHSSNSCF